MVNRKCSISGPNWNLWPRLSSRSAKSWCKRCEQVWRWRPLYNF